MKAIIQSNRFKRDLKRIKKRGYKLNTLAEIIDLLSKEESPFRLDAVRINW